MWEDISTGNERIFFIYGASGAGKSSLIDAGLRRRLVESRWWFSGPMQPSTENPDSIALNMWRVAEQKMRPGSQAADRSEGQCIEGIMNESR